MEVVPAVAAFLLVFSFGVRGLWRGLFAFLICTWLIEVVLESALLYLFPPRLRKDQPARHHLVLGLGQK